MASQHPSTATSSSSSFHTPMDRTDRPQPSQTPDVAPTAVSDNHNHMQAFPRPLISTLGWDLKTIVESSKNFHHVNRVHHSSPMAKVDNVIPELERDGLPLIICGWNRHPRWPKTMFNTDWLRKHGDQNPTVRNVHNWRDQKIPIDDFIKKLRETPAYAGADEHERLYGKDMDCPAQWTDWLANGDAIPDEFLFHGSNDFLKYLPNENKVQTLMCYMGIGDTFTPFHKDLCASSGQNLMCYAEHSGSAFWFMTKSSAAPKVAEYFHQLGQEVDLETHVVTIEELAEAPFDVYIAEQQLGDLVLVPPRSCHQVVNKGGVTIKTSWSRMSINGLQTALWHELPIYHRVCRQEIYKVKSTIFHALQHFTILVEDLPEGTGTNALSGNLKQLVVLFNDILAAEVSNSRDSMPHIARPTVSHTDDLHCDFCGADIFQSFFECGLCISAPSGSSTGVVPLGDGLILCPLCYVEGRTCQCEEMEPVQCRPFDELLRIRDRAVRAIQRIDDDNTLELSSRLLSGQHANIFEAACELFQKRRYESKATKSCRARRAHLVPATAALYCGKCHSSECYTHLLDIDYVHSVDALMRCGGDMDIWHEYHKSRQYQEAQQRVIEDEANGSRPDTLHRLTYLARNYTTYRAIAAEVTKHGWYDRFAQVTRIPILESPAKVLVGLPVDVDDDGACSQASDDIPLSKLIPRPTFTSGKNQAQPSRYRSPVISTFMDDDAENLSELTDLSTEPPLSPRSPSTAAPQPMDVIRSLPSSRATSSSFPVEGLQPKPRLVFDCVEIKQPEWYSGRKRNFPLSPPQQKQVVGLLPANVAESPPLDIRGIPSGSSKKRKFSQGPASRLHRPFKRANPPLIARDQPSNILANALNQTFQFNGTSATLTTPRTLDVISPVNNAVMIPTPRPQYRDIGIQKNPWTDFARTTSNAPSSETFTCIMRLERENSDLRAQVQALKHHSEIYRESLEEIAWRFGSSGPRPPHSAPHSQLPPPSGSPNIAPLPTQTFSFPARWRAWSFRAERQFRAVEAKGPGYPPIETFPLPTPSSPETLSPTVRQRTPTEPRRMRARKDGHDHSARQPGPYVSPENHGRQRSLSEPSGKLERQSLFARIGRVVGSSVAHSFAAAGMTKVEPSSHSPTMATATAASDHDKAQSLTVVPQ